MKYKLFISDFDGTLGKAPGYVANEDLIAIKEYEEKGGIFAICTGRMFCSIQSICNQYGLDGVVASYQGAMIKHTKTGETLFNGGLDKETTLEITQSFLDEGLQTVVDIEDVLYYQKQDAYIEFYEKACKVKGVLVPDLIEFVKKAKGQVSKVCAICDEEVSKRLTPIYNDRYKGKKMIFNNGSNRLIEAINPKCSKNFAVRFLADYYKIPLDQVIVVGDSTNDKEMVSGPWYSVAVGDGSEQLKDMVNEVTVDFKDHPVSTLLRKYCI